MSLSVVDETLQAAAVDPALWPHAIQAICDVTGAIGGIFLPVTGKVPVSPFSAELGETAERYVSEGWIHRDERSLGLPKLMRVGTFVDQDIVTPEGMAVSPYYNDFLKPLKLRWFAGLGFHAADEVWCLALQRTPKQGPFSAVEERNLLHFQGALSRAATMAVQFGHARVGGTVTALDALHAPTFLLDRLGRVLRMTNAAHDMVGHEFIIAQGQVRPRDSRCAQDFARLVAAALWHDVQPDSADLRPVVLERDGRRPFVIRAQPLRCDVAGCFGAARVMLMVTDLDRHPLPSLELVKRAFRLTQAEAQLALALARCFDLRVAAQQVGVSYETARFYLKVLFGKTQTSRQSELLAVLVRVGKNASPEL